jgi:hypothetical protein
MQKIAILLAFSIFTWTDASAQNLELSLKAGGVFAPSNFKAQNVSFSDTQTDAAEGIGATFQVKKALKNNFWWGIEGGISQYKNTTRTTLTFSNFNNKTITEVGDYHVEQFNFSALAEYRFGSKKLLIINVGAGIYKDYVSEYSRGTRYDYGDPTVPAATSIEGFSYGRDNIFGFFLGAGIRPMLTQKIGIIADLRYTYLPRSTSGPDNILLSFNPISAQLGITYSIQ